MMVRLNVQDAILSILGKKKEEGYRDLGFNMPVKDLFPLIGLSASPMLYNYISGKNKRIEPERAMVIYEKFDILIDEWLTPEELAKDCTNRELSAKIARRPIKDIIEEIVEIDSIEDEVKLRRAIKQLIAKYY